jgi:excisionase family DNA binding protein
VNDLDMYPEWITSQLRDGEQTVRFYTAAEAAPLFRVAKSTIQTWVRTNRLKAMRTPGRELRIPHTEIRRLQERTPRVP